MKDENKTKRQLIQEILELRKRSGELEEARAESKRIEQTLKESERRYKQLVESATEFIHTTDIRGNFTFVNAAALKVAGYSLEELKRLKSLDLILPEYRQPLLEIYINQFRERKPTIYVEIPFFSKSGEVIWWGQNSSLVFEGEEIVGFHCVSRDITQLKRSEETLQRSEQEAKRLAQENEVIAEIGRIISSSMNIEEVYGRFAEEVKKIIPFDRLAINIINPKDNTIITAYFTGVEILGRQRHEVRSLTGSATEEVRRTRSSLFFQPEDPKEIQEIVDRFPNLLRVFKSGVRSLISVPLISKDEVIGVLLIQSTQPNAYTKRDLKLAERVGTQIAGAIENVRLFIERRQTEEAARKSEEDAIILAKENEVIAEIGRIISSTLNIEEVYARFTEEVLRLIPVDRTIFNIINSDSRTITNVYTWGIDIASRRPGDVYPLAGSASEKVMQTKSGMLIKMEDENEVTAWVPSLVPVFRAGIRSIISVPLISGDQVIGVLHLQSLKSNAYTEKELRIAERVGNQIAGAVANAQLFAELKKAEEKIKNALSLLNATLESTADGILVVDKEGKIAGFNRKFVQMWRIPQSIIAARDDDQALGFVLEQLNDPQGFLAKVRELYNQPAAQSFDILEFKDERVFERYSQPQWIGDQSVGRVWSFRDVTERKQAEKERENLIRELQKALSEVKTLKGIFPICASCKKIRDDKGYWNQVESYVRDHTEAEFTHGICPECVKKLYPDLRGDE